MMLAAHSMGLGTVWINQLKDTCGDAGVRKLLTAFGVPEDHDVYACCAIGTALGGAKAPDRKAGARRLWNKLPRGETGKRLRKRPPQTACKRSLALRSDALAEKRRARALREKTESLPVRECLLAFRRLIAGRHGIG